jgi:hypothetical protein
LAVVPVGRSDGNGNGNDPGFRWDDGLCASRYGTFLECWGFGACCALARAASALAGEVAVP